MNIDLGTESGPRRTEYLTAVPFWHEIVRITHEHVRRRGASLLVRSAPYD